MLCVPGTDHGTASSRLGSSCSMLVLGEPAWGVCGLEKTMLDLKS
jgi:hypothetical protein